MKIKLHEKHTGRDLWLFAVSANGTICSINNRSDAHEYVDEKEVRRDIDRLNTRGIYTVSID